MSAAKRTARDDATSKLVLVAGKQGAAVAEALAALGDAVVVIGGMATELQLRLRSVEHRPTGDLDSLSLDRRICGDRLVGLGADAVGESWQVRSSGLTVDVIEVDPQVDTAGLGDEDDLDWWMITHQWALGAYDSVTIAVTGAVTGAESVAARAPVHARIASPAALVAMKTASVPLRRSSTPHKRGSDLFDILQLATFAGDDILNRLRDADPVLRIGIGRRLVEWYALPATLRELLGAVPTTLTRPTLDDFDVVVELGARLLGSDTRDSAR